MAMAASGGAATRDIAASLFISPKTVEAHLTRISQARRVLQGAARRAVGSTDWPAVRRPESTGLIPAVAGYEELRARHVALADGLLEEHVARISWSAAEVAAEQRRALRTLLGVASARSVWHRERLAGIDLDNVTVEDIENLPVMTKSDLMDNFDDIVTDRRLGRAACESHLDLLSATRISSTSSTSSLRAARAANEACSSTAGKRGRPATRPSFASRCGTGSAIPSSPTVPAWPRSSPQQRRRTSPPPSADVLGNRNHASLPARDPAARGDRRRIERAAADDPAGLQLGAPPPRTGGRGGRLRIRPRRINPISEPLVPETRALLDEVWGVPVANGYGMSEGVFAGGCAHGIHLPDDLCLVEIVDRDGRAVPPGQLGQRILVTNLYNPALPLIRFEVTDEVQVVPGPCPCGSVLRRIGDPQGRLDDTFTYPDGTTVHPHVFRDVLGQHPTLVEYQVRQTTRGADIAIVTAGPTDEAAVASPSRPPCDAPACHKPSSPLTSSPRIDRQDSGKLKRFVPLRSTEK